jgi:alpha-tubulin suppressor-like RCC1 family protein
MRFSKPLETSLTRLQFVTVSDLNDLTALSALSVFKFKYEPKFFTNNVTPFSATPSITGTNFQFTSGTPLVIFPFVESTEADKLNNAIQFNTNIQNKINFILPSKHINSKNNFDSGKDTNYFCVHIKDGDSSFYLQATAFYHNFNNQAGAPHRFARAGYVFSQYSDEYVSGTYNILSSIMFYTPYINNNNKTITIIPVTENTFNTYYNTTSCITVSSDILSCISGSDNSIKCFLQQDENGDAAISFEHPAYTWLSDKMVRTPAAQITFPTFWTEYTTLSSLCGRPGYAWYEGIVYIRKQYNFLPFESEYLYCIGISSSQNDSNLPYFSETPYGSALPINFETDEEYLFRLWTNRLNDSPPSYVDETPFILNPSNKISNTLTPAYTGIIFYRSFLEPNNFSYEPGLTGIYNLFYSSISSLKIVLDNFTVPTPYLPVYADGDNNKITLKINLPLDTYQKPVENGLIPPASGYFQIVDLSKNNLTSVNLLSSKSLKNLNLDNNLLTDLNLQNNYLLQNLQANFNNLSGLNFNNNNLYNLINLNLSGNKLTQLNLNPCVQILNINVPDNLLTNVSFLSSYNILNLNLKNNQIQFNELKNIVNALSSNYSLKVKTDFTQNPGYNQTIINIINSSTNNKIGNNLIKKNQSLYNNNTFACGSIGNGSLGVGYTQGIVTIPINTNHDLSFVAINSDTKIGLHNKNLFYAGNKHSLKLSAKIISSGQPPHTTFKPVTSISEGTSTSSIFLPITSVSLDPQITNNLEFDKVTLDKNTCYLLSGNAMFAFGKDTNLPTLWNTTFNFNLQPLTGSWIDIISGPNATIALSTNGAAFLRYNSNSTWNLSYGLFGSYQEHAYDILRKFTHTSKLGFLSGAALGDSYCCLLSSNGIIWITGFIPDGNDFNFRKDYTGDLYSTLSAQLIDGTVINNMESKFNRIIGGNNKFFALSGKHVFVHGSSTADNGLQKGIFITTFTAVPSTFTFYTGNDVGVIALSGFQAYATGTQREGNLGTGGRDVSNGWYPLTGQWKDISVGYDHSMALDLSGRLYVVGKNDRSQFGNDTWGIRYNNWTGPFKGYYHLLGINDGLRFERVICGHNHTFALSGLSADVLFQTGQLPYGDFKTAKDLPLPYTPFTDWGQRVAGSFKDVSCFYSSALLLSSTGGALYATGWNDLGQLGLGDNTTRYGWTSGTFTCDKIATGYNHSAALTGNRIYTTGDNSFGQLGIGNFNNKNLWTLVNGDFTDIKCISNTTFALSVNGIWMATGYADNGAMGQKLPNKQYSNFIPISSFNNLYLSRGDYLFAQKDNQSYFSGYNGFGQSGTGKGAILKNLLYQVPNFTNKNIPLEVDDIACGLSHTLFLTGNKVYACGDNTYGQCGFEDTDNNVIIPSVIPGNYAKIFAGSTFTYLMSSVN